MRERHGMGGAAVYLGVSLIREERMHDRDETGRREDARLDRGVKVFYIACTLLVAFGALSALWRMLG